MIKNTVLYRKVDFMIKNTRFTKKHLITNKFCESTSKLSLNENGQKIKFIAIIKCMIQMNVVYMSQRCLGLLRLLFQLKFCIHCSVQTFLILL